MQRKPQPNRQHRKQRHRQPQPRKQRPQLNKRTIRKIDRDPHQFFSAPRTPASQPRGTRAVTAPSLDHARAPPSPARADPSTPLSSIIAATVSAPSVPATSNCSGERSAASPQSKPPPRSPPAPPHAPSALMLHFAHNLRLHHRALHRSLGIEPVPTQPRLVPRPLLRSTPVTTGKRQSASAIATATRIHIDRPMQQQHPALHNRRRHRLPLPHSPPAPAPPASSSPASAASVLGSTAPGRYPAASTTPSYSSSTSFGIATASTLHRVLLARHHLVAHHRIVRIERQQLLQPKPHHRQRLGRLRRQLIKVQQAAHAPRHPAPPPSHREIAPARARQLHPAPGAPRRTTAVLSTIFPAFNPGATAPSARSARETAVSKAAASSARAATTPSARTSTASRGRVPNVFGKISIPS